MLPTITVITPSYNQGQFIEQTIQSVLSQNYPRLEFIIVDGLSTDNTLEVVSPYLEKITLISEHDNGQTEAINKGIQLATGDIICWLNSDDYFLPNTLHTVGKFFAQNPNSFWLTGDCLIVNETAQPIQIPVQFYKFFLRLLPPFFYKSLTNAICQPATFWHRSMHQRFGLLNETLKYTMDYDWWLRLSVLQPPTIVHKKLAAFRIHTKSKGGGQYIAQFDEDYGTFCTHESSKYLRIIHKLHNSFVKKIYKIVKG